VQIRPAVLVEADQVFPAVPSEHPSWSSLGRSHAEVVLAFHRSVAVWPQLGFNVIVDGSPWRQLGLSLVRVP
jgi:hypothetical protein